MKTTLHTLLLPATLTFFATPLLAQEYCPPDAFNNGVEPICLVAFADLDHTSPSSTDSPAYEDFTGFVAHVAPGATYTVRITGNTDGTPGEHIAINFDWDRDLTFETHVELDDIYGAECDSVSGGSFTVPAGAALGTSRARVVKTFSYNADDTGCEWGSGYGQAEDYTIEVSPTAGIAEVDAHAFALYPNPTQGDLTLVNNGTGPVVDIRIVDMAGRTVHAERAYFAPGTSHVLPLAGRLSKGAYGVLLLNDGVRSTARVIIE